MNVLILEKLKKKFGKLKHSKGHMRRKKKIKQKNKIVLTKNQKEISNYIFKINNLINELEEEEKEKSSYYIDEFVYDELILITKYDVKKKLLLKEILNDPMDFYELYFFNNEEYLYSTYKLHKLYDMFTYSGEKYILSIFKEIYEIYKNKEYNGIVDEKLSENPYKTLCLNKTKDLTKTDVIKAYRKLALQYHPDKHVDEKDIIKKKQYNELFTKIDKAYKHILKNDFNDNKKI